MQVIIYSCWAASGSKGLGQGILTGETPQVELKAGERVVVEEGGKLHSDQKGGTESAFFGDSSSIRQPYKTRA
jgi:hypothetical protein